MRITSLFYCFMLYLLLSGCSSKSSVIELSNNDAGKTIQVNKGDSIVIELTGNPTTGYNWEVVEVDDRMLDMTGEPDYKASSDLLGAEGTFTFNFAARQAGSTNLHMEYNRPWEENAEPAESFRVIIEVK